MLFYKIPFTFFYNNSVGEYINIEAHNLVTLSKDLQSSESYGERTFNPGQCAYQAAKHCECWAATPFAQPLGPLKTIGTFTTPPDMAYVLAAELMTWIWSKVSYDKYKYTFWKHYIVFWF